MARSMPPYDVTTLFYEYLCQGDLRGVETTLRAGATVNLPKHPAITLAAQMGSVSLVECLIKFGANVNLTIPADITGAHGKLMWDKGTTAMYIAVHNFHLDVVRALRRAGADTNISNDEGVTPLMCACIGQEGREAEGAVMLREVLDAGADPTIATPEGMTAVHFAIVPGTTGFIGHSAFKDARGCQSGRGRENTAVCRGREGRG